MVAMYKPIAAFAAAGAIVGGITLAPNIVGAQEADEVPAPTEETQRAHRHFGPKLGLGDVDVDVDQAALREAVASGATVGEALEAQGVDLDELRANAADVLAERLAEAVEDGRLSQEEADAKAAEVEERIDERLDSTELERRSGHRGKDGLGRLLGDAEVDKDALRAAIEGGASMSDALAEQGIDLEQLQADALAAAQERLDDAVANGDIDEEMAARIQERLDGAADGDFEFGRRGRGFGHRGGFGSAPVDVDASGDLPA